jgi:hypothetical protein
MSIISDALSGRTTWPTAAAQIGAWFSQVLGPQPTAAATSEAGALMTDLKQTASDAVSLADTLMGPLLAAGALAVEAAADTALKAAIGPVAGVITPAMDTAISDVEAQLVAAIHTRALAFRASLAPKPQLAPAPVQPS